MSDAEKRKPVALVSDLEAAFRQLPKAEQETYEAARRSIVEARRYANAVEGHIYITS